MILPETRPRGRAAAVAALLVGPASIGAAVLAVILARLADGAGGASTFDSFSWALATGGIVFVAAPLGALAVARGRRPGLGWVVAGLGLGLSTSMLSQEYARYALGTGHWHAVPVDWAALTGYLVLVAALLAAPVFLLAEHGRWRSREWRYVTPVLLALGLVSFTLVAIRPGPLRTVAEIANPIGVGFFAGAGTLGLWLGLPAVAVALLLGFAELQRREQARPDEFAKPEQSEEPEEPDALNEARRPRWRVVSIVLLVCFVSVGAAALAVAGLASLGLLVLLPGPLKGFLALLLIVLLTIGLVLVPVLRRKVAKAQNEAAEPESVERPALGERPKRAWAFLKDFPRVFPYLRPHWKLGASSMSLLGFGVLAGLLSPWPLAILVDTVLGNKPLPSVLGFIDGWSRTTLLVFAVVAGVVVTALEHGVGMGQAYVDTALEERMGLDVRSDLFRHMQRLSQAFHDKTKRGMMIFTVTKSTSVGSVTTSIGPIVQNLATLVGMFFIAYKIDSQLALISLAVVPFIYYSTGYYTRRIEPRLYYVQNLEGQAMSIAYEAMAMLRVIVAFGREKHEYGRFRSQGEEAVSARINLTVLQTFFSLAVSVLTATGTALVLGFGAWHVLQHQLTVGELLVVMSYIAAVYQPLQEITSTLASLQQEFISMRMVLNLLEVPADIEEDPDAISIEHAKGNLVLEDVSFNYEGREGTLQNISFAVSAGQRVGIVGPTGAGKSTLVSLFPRFCDPNEGRILLEGIPTRKLTLESLRNQFSVVHQEPMLFSGTIADNIRYGRLGAADEEVEAASRAANAHDFISALPKGYGTTLGEGGAQLSGGERQRIAVARAFLKDAPILVLDEPTSSIDSDTESVILDALERLMVGRTTITIAHRLGTIRGADLVLVMDGGRIVERGTHAELLALDGLYRRLHDAQVADGRRYAEASDALHDRMVSTVTRILEEPALTLRERAERAGQVLRDAESEMSGESLRGASGGQERP